MLQINFTAETANDHITPLTISHAIIQNLTSDSDDYENSIDLVEEISRHLSDFVCAQRGVLYREERKREAERFASVAERSVTNG